MKASINWLKKYIDLEGLTPEEIADKLTFAGVESEGVFRLANATGLVIGEILSCEAHPDSDHLHILQVDEGKEFGVHQIVCGAPNARKGLKVIVAREGAVLPEVTIKKGVIRGVESDGMCCSLVELGVDKKFLSEAQTAGIEELPFLEKLSVGGNGLKVLDVSALKNLEFLSCGRDKYEKIIFDNPELSYLYIISTPLKELDTSGLPVLGYLDSYDNPFEFLSFKENPRMEHLILVGAEMEELDLSTNPRFDIIYVRENENLRVLWLHPDCKPSGLDINDKTEIKYKR